jgi:hypothetical protein
MDLAQLLHRKAELEQARVNVANSWQVLTGHIQECDHMITLLSAPQEDEGEIKGVEAIESSNELDVE